MGSSSGQGLTFALYLLSLQNQALTSYWRMEHLKYRKMVDPIVGETIT